MENGQTDHHLAGQKETPEGKKIEGFRGLSTGISGGAAQGSNSCLQIQLATLNNYLKNTGANQGLGVGKKVSPKIGFLVF